MSNDQLGPAQQAIDDTVSEWPDVRAKPVFGHRGWVRNGKMFGFIAEEGVAVKAFAGSESDALFALDGVVAFVHNGMAMRAWPILPLRAETEVETALTALHSAYERAVAT